MYIVKKLGIIIIQLYLNNISFSINPIPLEKIETWLKEEKREIPSYDGLEQVSIQSIAPDITCATYKGKIVSFSSLILGVIYLLL